MARIQLSELISDISGSVGGTTFSRNNAGLVAKSRIVGKRIRTSKQQIALQNSTRITDAWKALSLYDKFNWNAFAAIHTKTNRYGQVKILSGFTWFKSINQARYFVNGTLTTSPPVYDYPSFLPTFDLTLSTSDIIIDWSEVINPAEVALYIYSTPPITGTARYNRGGYRLTVLKPKDYSSSFSILEEWEQAHGLVWADLAATGNFYMNVQIFAISKTTFMTGTSVTATGELS